jgi:hypothetical protein
VLSAVVGEAIEHWSHGAYPFTPSGTKCAEVVAQVEAGSSPLRLA